MSYFLKTKRQPPNKMVVVQIQLKFKKMGLSKLGTCSNTFLNFIFKVVKASFWDYWL